MTLTPSTHFFHPFCFQIAGLIVFGPRIPDLYLVKIYFSFPCILRAIGNQEGKLTNSDRAKTEEGKGQNWCDGQESPCKRQGRDTNWKPTAPPGDCLPDPSG